ncbi:MAG: hypothetical protein IPK11_08750 [Ignavibacteria bacterium]|nr:hypothetical protein [Ignavibacteria bacterium]
MTASGDSTAKLWDANTGDLLFTLKGHNGRIYSAKFNAAGDKVLTASTDFTSKLWDVATGRLLATLSGHVAVVNSAVFNSKGDKIVTASEDGTAKMWDISSITSVNESPTMSSRAEMTISPNPVIMPLNLFILWVLTAKQSYLSRIYMDREVADLALENLGTYRQTIQTHDWTDGVYVIVLRTVHETVSQKVVIVR